MRQAAITMALACIVSLGCAAADKSWEPLFNGRVCISQISFEVGLAFVVHTVGAI